MLERLVAVDSTVGREGPAQEVLAGELETAGLAVHRLHVPGDIGSDPDAGVPSRPYAGRYDLVAERGSRPGRSLLLNGHIDVVPADDEEPWTSPPFTPTPRDGWLVGRGVSVPAPAALRPETSLCELHARLDPAPPIRGARPHAH